MKLTTRIIHRLVFYCRMETIFIVLRRVNDLFHKFLPLPVDYYSTDLIKCKRDNVNFLVNRSDYMQWVVYANEPDNSWKAATEFLDSNSIVLDVGANFGAFSFKVAEIIRSKQIGNCSIHAFEPNPFVVEKFRMNLGENPNLQELVHLHAEAIGAEEKYISMDFSKSNTGGGRVMVELEKGEIPMTTIDKLVSLNNWQISFMKIDVEGFEPFVLQGASETVRTQQPAIFMEMTDKWFRAHQSSNEDIVDYFMGLDYRVMIESHRGFIEMDSAKSIPKKDQFNILFVPTRMAD